MAGFIASIAGLVRGIGRGICSIRVNDLSPRPPSPERKGEQNLHPLSRTDNGRGPFSPSKDKSHGRGLYDR